MIFDIMSKVIHFGNIFHKDKDHFFRLRLIVDKVVVVVVVAAVVEEVVLIVLVVGQTVGDSRADCLPDDENFFPIQVSGYIY